MLDPKFVIFCLGYVFGVRGMMWLVWRETFSLQVSRGQKLTILFIKCLNFKVFFLKEF